MEASSFLIIGLVGFVLLAISAFIGSDDADIDVDSDFDIDIDTDTDADIDFDSDSGDAISGGSAILQWFSIKALSIAAVGFGFVGWALTSNGAATFIIWLAAIATGFALWALAVLFLFPWIRMQQGNDLQPLEAYQGITGDVVVRIPPDGVGTVQFTDPNGAVIRRDARSIHRGHEVPVGKSVVIVLATEEHVSVDEFSLLEEPS